MLGGSGEERGCGNRPKVEPGQIPRISDVAEVEPKNRPKVLFHPCFIAVRQKVVGESNDRRGTECWPIALRATPVLGKGCLINVKLWFAEAARVYAARWVL